MKRQCLILILPLALALILTGALGLSDAYAQEQASSLAEMKKLAPKVYIDCEDCDQDYIRTEIPFVNYVRDRKEADVHVLITTQTTGSGGTEYTIAFIGQGSYEKINSTLIYASSKTDTEEEIRRGYVAVLKMGLLPYASRTPIRDLISVSFKEKVKPTDVVDRWKFWVFSLRVGGELDRESQTKSDSINLTFSANKVTPDIKLRMGFSAGYQKDEFNYEDEKITSDSDQVDFAGVFVKSLGEHWSAGVALTMSSSAYSNLRFKITPTPAIEYDFFPYSESTRRQLRILYKVGYEFVKYREMTIYDKTKESLLGQSLLITLEIKEPWGTLSTSIEGSHYFHDFNYNRLAIYPELSFRIFKGLDFNIDGMYERVRDQLSLPASGASREEILLRRKELRTDYNLSLSVSLSYTFGSIFSNVVNPRFGDLGVIHHWRGGWD